MTTMYSGNSTYCYSDSLRMCLAQAGLADLPEVGLLECMTGMPFGATFLKLDPPLFFPNAAALNPDLAILRALEVLGWGCETWRGAQAADAEAVLREIPQRGPLLLGPVDMGHLRYDPDHASKAGGDHFVVVLEIKSNTARLHDPQRYPLVTLSVDDLVQAWNATALGYTEAPYTLRHSFHQREPVSQQARLDRALAQAAELLAKLPEGPVVYGGARAFSLAAEALRGAATPPFKQLFAAFALPLGARRCLDAASFFQAVDQDKVAQHFLESARLYGQAQGAAATGRWTELAGYLERLAELGAHGAEQWA